MYDQMMQERAHQLAGKLIKNIGKQLLKNKEYVESKNFRQSIQKGRRLTVKELGLLKQTRKDDYFEEIL